jgi:hypothetical protein
MKSSTSRALWIGGAAAGAAAVVGTLVVLTSKSANAAPSSGGAWIKLQPGQNPIGMFQALIPPNAQFAISDVADDPGVTTIISQLNMLATNGQILSPQGYQAGQAPPAGFPSDGLGNNAYRATGTVSSQSPISIPVTQTTTVWMKQQPTQNYLALVTDPATVTQYQSMIASAIAQGKGGLIVGPNAPVPSYTSADVDGNPANPTWMTIIADFQTYVNSGGPLNTGIPGFPLSLRTDGVLDYATAIVLMNA